ncbi:MAG: amphi-Trp domain-containing protein [Desulfobacteraceae bacterium]|jgi:amphi-Trp domain-containing protein
MGKNSVAMEKKMSASEVVSFLESIIASLKEGKIVIQQGTQFVVLQPEDLITVEVEASQKMEKGKLSIDIKWKQPEELQPEADILVSSVEPEPVPEPEMKPEPKKEAKVKANKTGKKQSPKPKKKAKPGAKK